MDQSSTHATLTSENRSISDSNYINPSQVRWLALPFHTNGEPLVVTHRTFAYTVPPIRLCFSDDTAGIKPLRLYESDDKWFTALPSRHLQEHTNSLIRSPWCTSKTPIPREHHSTWLYCFGITSHDIPHPQRVHSFQPSQPRTSHLPCNKPQNTH
jgi:hypothetical protein